MLKQLARRAYSTSPKYNPALFTGAAKPKLTSTHASAAGAGSEATASVTAATGVSQDEISHFQQLAPSWWDTNGPQRILHKMNLARLDFFQSTLQSQVKIANPDIYVPGFNYKDHLPAPVAQEVDRELQAEIRSQLASKSYTVLDIGCGGGILAESVARLPFVQHVTAIDLTPDVIEVARGHKSLDPMLESKLDYQLKPLEQVAGVYDIVTMFEMLEHVDSPHDILAHSWDKLKPEGFLFLSTINRDFVSWFTTIFMGEKVLGIVPDGTHHLEKYIDSREIVDWFSQNKPGQFELVNLKGAMYFPLQGWITHDCSDIGNYFMAIRKLE